MACPSGQATSSFTEAEDAAVVTVTIVSGALSMAGSLFILLTYWAVPKLRNDSFGRVAILSACDLVSSANYVLGGAADPGASGCVTALCYANALIAQLFEVASFLWTAVIGHHLVRTLVQRRTSSIDRAYHAVCWGVPVVLAAVAMHQDAFGDAGSWCWIKSDEHVLRALLYYVPLIAIIVFNAACYIRVGRYMLSTSSPLADRVVARMGLYLLVFVVCSGPAVLNRTVNWLDPHPHFALYLLHAGFAPLQGLGNALVYGATQRVRSELAKTCCARRHEEDAKAQLRASKHSLQMSASSSETAPI